MEIKIIINVKTKTYFTPKYKIIRGKSCNLIALLKINIAIISSFIPFSLNSFNMGYQRYIEPVDIIPLIMEIIHNFTLFFRFNNSAIFFTGNNSSSKNIKKKINIKTGNIFPTRDIIFLFSLTEFSGDKTKVNI